MYNIELKVLGNVSVIKIDNASYVVTDTHYNVITPGGESYFTKIHTLWFKAVLVVREGQ